MTNIYRAKDLAELFDKITTNSIGLDRTIQNFWESTNANYPHFNIIQENNHESTLEIALAGFKKKEVKVYTEHGKLIVEGKKEEKKEKKPQNNAQTKPNETSKIRKEEKIDFVLTIIQTEFVSPRDTLPLEDTIDKDFIHITAYG